MNRHTNQCRVNSIALTATLLLGSAEVAVAGSWTAPLSFQTASSPDGEYLAAEFDLGVRLRDVESATVTFTMPDGFERRPRPGEARVGVYVITDLVLWLDPGGSRSDDAVDAGSNPRGFFYLGGLVSGGPRVIDRVAEDTPTSFTFTQPNVWQVTGSDLLSLDGELVEVPRLESVPNLRWIDAFSDGVGVVTIAVWSRWNLFNDPLPTRPPASAVIDASITVTGVAVPEPGAAALLVGGVIVAARRRARESRE